MKVHRYATSMGAKPHSLPFIAAIAGIALFSIMDALMKRASIAGGVYSVMLVRSAIGGALAFAVWHARGGRWPARHLLKLHALRGVVCAGMATSFFYGIVRTPLAQAMAISFIAPLIALYLAAVLLGEKVRRRAVVASLMGLAGVAVIAAERLGTMSLDGEAAKGIAAVLFSAVLYAWNLILQRQQALLSPPLEVALFQNVFVGLTLLPLLPWLWQAPPVSSFGDIVGAAVFALAAVMLLSWAWGRAEAQVLVPIEYSAFIWAALMGWWWFGETLSVTTLASTALIVAGCWIGTRPPPAPHPA